jgi:diguanylate cyclase (GGDEF)-like protein
MTLATMHFGIDLALKNYFRGSDIACRYGGEEFTLILPEATLPDVIHRLHELCEHIKKLTNSHNGRAISQFSASIGVAVYPQHRTIGEQLGHGRVVAA